ncbi:PHP domain-containing protein, partial [Candidatus Woesearchaeota archaeon]|nr:PHP domain-containing protein [Candidatus Woesearchaeota archaeon]
MTIGLDMLVFTNFADSRYEDLKKTALKLSEGYHFSDYGKVFYVSYDEKIFAVIKGQEVPTKQGHILTVGGSSEINNYKDMKETIDEAKDKGAIVIADHPYTTLHGGMGEKNLEKYLDQWDAIEVFNAQNINLVPFLLNQKQSNEKARAFARKHNLPSIATSDSHRLNEIAVSYITFKERFGVMEPDKLIASLRGIIRNKQFEAIERYNSWGSFVSWAVPFEIKAKLGYYDNKKNNLSKF